MKTCSFFGHRNVVETEELRQKIKETILSLVKDEGVSAFLFGSKSNFDGLCLDVVSEIKTVEPRIKLVYYRASFPYIGKDYEEYLLETYDETLMPKGVENAGRASYVERNQAMIDASDFCVFYYDENYAPQPRKHAKRDLFLSEANSGTKLAYQYATRKKKKIYNLHG